MQIREIERDTENDTKGKSEKERESERERDREKDRQGELKVGKKEPAKRHYTTLRTEQTPHTQFNNLYS